MKKVNIVKSSRDFDRIINSVKPYHTKNYLLFIEKKEASIYNFGFSVGKKIGNAVCRNKIRRQLKSIVDKKSYQNNFNCIIMVKKSILNIGYSEREKELLDAFEKMSLYEGETK